jgi:hypothetical protein
LGSLARPRLLAGAWALQRLQPRKQKAVLVHALDRSGRNGLHMSVRVLGQDDIHGMGLIKGLHCTISMPSPNEPEKNTA